MKRYEDDTDDTSYKTTISIVGGARLFDIFPLMIDSPFERATFEVH